MIQVVPLRAWHMAFLRSTGALGGLSEFTDDKVFLGLETGVNFTVLKDEIPIASGGVLHYWQNRGELWAVLNTKSPADFFVVHRATTRFIDALQYRRLEATVVSEYENGHRWMRLLGFQVEAPLLKNYTVKGEDVTLYAKIKE